jgi:hypothetical protein
MIEDGCGHIALKFRGKRIATTISIEIPEKGLSPTFGSRITIR